VHRPRTDRTKESFDKETVVGFLRGAHIDRAT
jgi:hypothetical protein